MRVFAVDPSLTCSGWALFDVASKTLLSIGKLKSISTSFSLEDRLLDLQRRIDSIYVALQLTKRDIVVCEAPTTMRDPKAAFKVEQVRGVFETLARSRDIEVFPRVHPRTVQYELLGLKGKQIERKEVKATAVFTAKALYESSLRGLGFPVTLKELTKHQDIVDAVLLGHVAVGKIAESKLMQSVRIS